MSSRTERNVLRAAVAVAFAVMLYRLAPIVASQTAVLMYGNNAGAAKPITVDASGNLNVKCLSGCTGGGGGTPGGATTNVQYNNAGAFAGSANFTFSTGTSTNVLIKGGSAQSNLIRTFEVQTGGGLNMFSVDEPNGRVNFGGAGQQGQAWYWGSGAIAAMMNGPTEAYITVRSIGKFAFVNGGDVSSNPVDLALSRSAANTLKIEDGSGNVADSIAHSLSAQRNGTGSTSSDGILVSNTTAATAGQRQDSGAVHWQGQYWTGSLSSNADVKAEILTVGTTPTLVFNGRTGATGYVNVLGVGVGLVSASNWSVAVYGSTQAGNCNVPSAFLHNSGRGACLEFNDSQPVVVGTINPANGYLRVLNNGTTAGSAYAVYATNNTTRYFNVTNGVAGAGTQISGAQGTPPTVTTNGGTSPACVGGDSLMKCTIGTAPPAAATFTVTFNGTYAAAPSCLAIRATAGASPLVQSVTTTTTTAVVNLSGNLVASETYAIHCGDVQ